MNVNVYVYSNSPHRPLCLQGGRVALYLSGMRGAPPNPDFSNFSAPARPQTAMGLIRGDMAGGAPKQVMYHISSNNKNCALGAKQKGSLI